MRKIYKAEFKRKVVLEILREEKTIAQIASEYEIHPTQLARWKKAVLEGMLTALDDKRVGQAQAQKQENEALVQDLYAQIGELSAKLTWLKKKSGVLIE